MSNVASLPHFGTNYIEGDRKGAIMSLESNDGAVYQTIKSNPDGINQLFFSSYKRVFAYVRSLCKDVELSKDITQQAFTIAWEKFAKFEHQSSFATWVNSIARNILRYYFRSRIKEETLSYDDAEKIPCAKPLPDEKLEHKELQTLVHNLINLLPKKEKFVLQARLIEKLSYAIIISETGQSKRACQQCFCRALSRIRKLLQGEFNEHLPKKTKNYLSRNCGFICGGTHPGPQTKDKKLPEEVPYKKKA